MGKRRKTYDSLLDIHSSGATISAGKNPSIDAAVFTGVGLNDMTSGGTFTGIVDTNYVVEIDLAAANDKFKWSDDGGVAWDATDVVITGAAQALNNGVTVTFAAITGHTLGESWAFTANVGAWAHSGPGVNSSGTALSYDTGGGFTEGDVVIDIQVSREIVAASGFFARLYLEGSLTSTFVTIVPLALLEFGEAYAIQASGAKLGVGRYFTPFCNDFGGTLYRYLRMYHMLGGTSATGIQYRAFLGK